MNSISAQRLFEGVNDLFTGESELPPDADFATWRGHLDLSLGEAWNSEWWQFLMKGEFRRFRALWLAGTTYNKTDEVYDAATQQYFQCLRNSVTGAGNSPTDSSGIARPAYWSLCKSNYTGSNWASGVAYAVGDIKFYPVDDIYYQCHTAHTSSGTLTPDATGGNERWGVLTPFERYVDFLQPGKTEIGDVLAARSDNPRVTTDYDDYEHETLNDRCHLRDAVTRVWLDFRLRRPRLTGTFFDEADAYAAGDQVYFFSDSTAGNFYTCLATTTAGQSPDTHAALWSVVEIPEQFQPALIWSTYAKVLIADGRADESRSAMQMAEGYLALETDRKYRQAGDTPSIAMRSYP